MTDVDVVIHRAGPKADEPPYFRSCVDCREPWPCTARRAEIQAEADEMKTARIDDARRIGVLALVERGVSVWSSTRVDAYGEPLGGVVVHIDDVPNRETGEFERFFTCLDPVGGVPVTVRRLAEAEVLPTGVEATAHSRITKLIKRLAAEVAAMTGSYLDVHHADRIRWMSTLASVTTLAN